MQHHNVNQMVMNAHPQFHVNNAVQNMSLAPQHTYMLQRVSLLQGVRTPQGGPPPQYNGAPNQYGLPHALAPHQQWAEYQ